MKKHYTYLIEYSNGRLYHGVRSCEGSPEEDEKYVGSSLVTPNEDVVEKTILTKHDTRSEAEVEELRYHNEHQVHHSATYYNLPNASVSGYTALGRIGMEEGETTTPTTSTHSTINGSSEPIKYAQGQNPNSKATQFTSERAKLAQKASVESRLANKGGIIKYCEENNFTSPNEFLLGVMNDDKANMAARMKAADILSNKFDPNLSSVTQQTTVKEVPSFNVGAPKMTTEDLAKIADDARVVMKKSDEESVGIVEESGGDGDE